MEEMIMQYGEQLLTWIQNAANFVGGELPSFVAEIIRFKTISTIVELVLYVAGIAGIVVVTMLFVKWLDEECNEEFIPLTWFLSSVCVLVLFGCLVVASINLVQVYTAPRLFILEYLMEVF